MHTLDHSPRGQRLGATPNERQRKGNLMGDGHTESDVRLNKLISDYRVENERCTRKINELKDRLGEAQTH